MEAVVRGDVLSVLNQLTWLKGNDAEKAAFLNAVDEYDGNTALHKAICRCDYDANTGAIWEMVEGLLDAGADVNIMNSTGETALVFAAESDIDDIVAAALLDAGADPNAFRSPGRPPLYHAVYEENASLTRVLIDAGADVNAVINDDEFDDEFKTSLLHCVLEHSVPPTVQLLLDAGADPNAAFGFGVGIGDTPFMLACCHANDPTALLWFVAAGADFHAVNNGGANVLAAAAFAFFPRNVHPLIAIYAGWDTQSLRTAHKVSEYDGVEEDAVNELLEEAIVEAGMNGL